MERKVTAMVSATVGCGGVAANVSPSAGLESRTWVRKRQTEREIVARMD